MTTTPTDAALAAAIARMDECRAGCDAGDPFYSDAKAWDTIRAYFRARELDAQRGSRELPGPDDDWCTACGYAVPDLSQQGEDYYAAEGIGVVLPEPPRDSAEEAAVANAIAREDSGYSADELNAGTRRRYYLQARAAIAAIDRVRRGGE